MPVARIQGKKSERRQRRSGQRSWHTRRRSKWRRRLRKRMRSWSWQTAWRTCASCAARSALVLSSISATMSSLNTFSPEQSTAISTPSLLAMKGRPFTGIVWCFYFSILFMVSISWSNYNSSKFQWSDKFINWNVQKMLVLLRLCPVVLGLVKIRFLR